MWVDRHLLAVALDHWKGSRVQPRVRGKTYVGRHFLAVGPVQGLTFPLRMKGFALRNQEHLPALRNSPSVFPPVRRFVILVQSPKTSLTLTKKQQSVDVPFVCSNTMWPWVK